MLFPEASRDESLSKIERTLKGEYWKSVEIPILRKDGEIRIVLWNSANIYAEDAKTLLSTIAQGTDITKHKQADEEIRKLNGELERRIEERTKKLSQVEAELFQTSKLATLGEMSAGLAHEMNQPLRGISLIAKNFRKLMEMGKLSQEELKSGLKDIETSVKRMSKVIQHIRTFARQDTLKFVEVDVNETIDSALSLLGEQLRLHEIEIVRNSYPTLPKITGEPYQLEQVWINLITNARDAMDEKGKQMRDGRLQIGDYRKKLTISTSYNPESKIMGIRVQDNGIGMSKEEKEKAFEPFFTTKEVGKATGLGLSISYGIIESHKGRIEMGSEKGKGTTVKVILPIG